MTALYVSPLASLPQQRAVTVDRRLLRSLRQAAVNLTKLLLIGHTIV